MRLARGRGNAGQPLCFARISSFAVFRRLTPAATGQCHGPLSMPAGPSRGDGLTVAVGLSLRLAGSRN